MGAQRAAMAANGLDISFGSAADLVADSALFAEEDSRNLAENTNREARGFLIQGANYRSEAASQRNASSSALIAGGFGVASSLIGGAKEYGKLRKGMAG